MSTFDMLSNSMRKKVWDMKWERFTVIQEMTIPVVIQTDKDIVVSSGTASGKTEAVFLPVLSLVEKEAREKVKVLYISPLKALINNQFERIEKLCEYNQIKINRWHGDVDHGQKKKFVKDPSGILQITPESIESLFVNRTEYIRSIFKDIEFIIIDEIHSFIDKDRGVQLRSLISRLETYCDKRPRIIGLSATIDNFEFVKEWINYENPNQVEVLQTDEGDKELNYYLMHFPLDEENKKPVELYEDIRALTRDIKSIIFCNSRGGVEEITVFLNRLAKREGVGETYYPHHSSIDKKEREYVEKTIATATVPKSVIATSSLELGIDIGKIELVIQIDNTFTVSSLKQRLGRSGRESDKSQILQLYTTSMDSLIQSLAVMELVLEKWVEPSTGYSAPYDIMFHQILSLCHEFNGMTLDDLLVSIKNNGSFHHIKAERIVMQIEHMLQYEYLELIPGENVFVVGLAGERLMRGKEFYPVFMTSEEYEVFDGARVIGMLDKGYPIAVDDNVILAGKLWTIVDIDENRNKIRVIKAVSAKPPRYLGGSGELHPRVAEKMMEILCSNKTFNYINDEGTLTLEDARKYYRLSGIGSNQQRVFWIKRDEVLFESYTGTKIAKTLTLMFRSMGFESRVCDSVCRIQLNGVAFDQLKKVLEQLKYKEWFVDELLEYVKENEWFASKYSSMLPADLLIEMHIAHEMDVKGAIDFLKNKEFVVINIDE